MSNLLTSIRLGGGAWRTGAPRGPKASIWRRAAAIVAVGVCFWADAASSVSAQAVTEAPSLAQRASRADFLDEAASPDARQVANWVVSTGDAQGLPFVIVDKKDARVFVFDCRGRLRGATPALLGLARGDDSAPGVGDRKLSEIRPEERTTPAGRFMASLGHDLGKHDVLWVDYPTALALHRVLAANTREHRLERLAAASPLDHRITFGCINVPVDFYDKVVDSVFARTAGVVYILPEIKTISEVFFTSSS